MNIAKIMLVAVAAALGYGMIKTFSRMAISPQGIAELKGYEAWSPVVYPDEGGRPTIGFGHLLLPGESFPDGITPAMGEQLLRQDLFPAVTAVNNLVKVPLAQNQFDALVMFVFNVGVGAFAESTLLRKLNAGDYDGAGQEFARWNKITKNGVKVISSGLVNRREKERTLFIA